MKAAVPSFPSSGRSLACNSLSTKPLFDSICIARLKVLVFFFLGPSEVDIVMHLPFLDCSVGRFKRESEGKTKQDITWGGYKRAEIG
jgi:hypothetical protein